MHMCVCVQCKYFLNVHQLFHNFSFIVFFLFSLKQHRFKKVNRIPSFKNKFWIFKKKKKKKKKKKNDLVFV